MIRLIGIDVDGTLLDSEGRMPDANRDAIHEAVARRHSRRARDRPQLSVRAAGGRPAAVEPHPHRQQRGRRAQRWTAPRWRGGCSTAHVARAGCSTIDTRYRDAAALIFDRDVERQIVFETMDWEHPGRKGYWARNQSLIAQCVPLEDALVEDPIQVMFNGGVEAMRALAAALRREVADVAAVSLTEYVHRDFSLVDVTAPTATKGHALAWRAEQLGLTRDEVMAVGDNFNDLEMLDTPAHRW